MLTIADQTLNQPLLCWTRCLGYRATSWTRWGRESPACQQRWPGRRASQPTCGKVRCATSRSRAASTATRAPWPRAAPPPSCSAGSPSHWTATVNTASSRLTSKISRNFGLLSDPARPPRSTCPHPTLHAYRTICPLVTKR